MSRVPITHRHGPQLGFIKVRSRTRELWGTPYCPPSFTTILLRHRYRHQSHHFITGNVRVSRERTWSEDRLVWTQDTELQRTGSPTSYRSQTLCNSNIRRKSILFLEYRRSLTIHRVKKREEETYYRPRARRSLVDTTVVYGRKKVNDRIK